MQRPVCPSLRESKDRTETERLRFTPERRGVKISIKKTDYLQEERRPPFKLHGNDVLEVEEFTYLSWTIQGNGD